MSTADGTQAPPSPVTLNPRVAPWVGAVLSAMLFGWVGVRIIQLMEIADAWWIASLFFLFSGGCVVGAFRQLKQRASLVLHVAPDRFQIGDVTVRHFQVTEIRRYKNLQFKGVRVDLGSEAWVAISATHHEPGRVLRVFRKLGWPVAA